MVTWVYTQNSKNSKKHQNSEKGPKPKNGRIEKELKPMPGLVFLAFFLRSEETKKKARTP